MYLTDLKVTDRPHKVTDQPHKVTDRPHNVSDLPDKVTDRPHNVSDRPHKVTDRPHRVTDQPQCLIYNQSHKIALSIRILTLITLHTIYVCFVFTGPHYVTGLNKYITYRHMANVVQHYSQYYNNLLRM